MKRKNFLDLIDVPNPCEKSWDEMLGDDKSRHCLHCDKDIHNLSELSSKEAEKLLFKSKGRVCVRMTRDTQGKIVTNDDKFYQIKRQAKFATSVLSITLALTSVAFTKTANTENKGNNQTISQSQKLLTLTIADENGAIIPNAQIKIINLENKQEQTAISDENGEAKFIINKLGKYEIIVSNAKGFKELRRVVDFNKENVKINLKLEVDKENLVGTIVTAGAEIKENTQPEIGIVGEQRISKDITKEDIETLPINSNSRNSLTLPTLEKANKSQQNTSQISFTIYDPNNAVIANAEVKLTHEKTKQEFIINTDDKGVAYFYGLPRGRYKIEATCYGFQKNSMNLVLKEQIEPNIKMTLEVGVFVGVVAVNWHEVPIFNSIVQQDVDVIKNYISAGKNVNIKNKENVTLLHVAAQSGNVEIIKLLLDAGANVNAKDKRGKTPLLMTDVDEEKDLLEILKLFIAKGVDVNIQYKDENNQTLLMLACDDDNLEAVKILLEAGANPNLKDSEGETAMMKTDSEEIKNLLRQYGAKK
jgi:ankyrin repeat protein